MISVKILNHTSRAATNDMITSCRLKLKSHQGDASHGKSWEAGDKFKGVIYNANLNPARTREDRFMNVMPFFPYKG